MFRLSKSSEYAIRGILHLSLQKEGQATGVEEIARAQDVPTAYLAKLFQSLSRKGFLRSFRGPEGGFRLARSPKDINLLEVIEAVEGPIFLNDCLIHSGYCPKDDVCPVHDVWKEAQKGLLDCLGRCSFEDLAISAMEKERRKTQKSIQDEIK